jgi:hypothetical protein
VMLAAPNTSVVKGMDPCLLKSQSFQSRIESLIQNVSFEQWASAL